MRELVALTALTFASLLLASACGGDGGSAGTPTPTATPTPSPSPTASSTPTPVPTPTREPTPKLASTPTPTLVWSDGRVGVSVDRVEKANVLPPDVIESMSGRVPTLTEGQDYVIVNLTIARIESVHVVGFLGHGDEQPSLSDAEGQSYEPVWGQLQGIRFLDPQDITAGSEAVEGTAGILVFQIPIEAKPASLSLVYSFKETLEETSPDRGQIDITL